MSFDTIDLVDTPNGAREKINANFEVIANGRYFASAYDTIQAAHDAVPSGETAEILLDPNTTYQITNAGGLNLTKRVILRGYPSTVLEVGLGVGNGPGVTVAYDRSILEGFQVVGAQSGFLNSSLYGAEQRRAIRATGDYIELRRLQVDDAVVGVEAIAGVGGMIDSCLFRNSLLRRGYVGAVNNCAAVFLRGAQRWTIKGSDIEGYGQGVLTGGHGSGLDYIESAYHRILGTDVRAVGDNCVYVSSGDSIFVGDWCHFSDYVQAAIKARGSNHVLEKCRIEDIGGSANIVLTGNGPLEDGKWNGRNVTVQGMVASGTMNTGIQVVGFYDGVNAGWGHLRDVRILDNDWDFFDRTDPDYAIAYNPGLGTNSTRYAVYFPSGLAADSQEARSDGLVVRGNRSRGHRVGLYLGADGSTLRHLNADVDDNDWTGAENYGEYLRGMAYSQVRREKVHAVDTLMEGSSDAAIHVRDSTYNKVYLNAVDDQQAVPTLTRGIEEAGASGYNEYWDNRVANTDRRYYFLSATSSVRSSGVSGPSVMSGTETFRVGDARTFIRDTGGSARILNPSAPSNETFTAGYEVEVVNIGAQTITFDSTGIAQAVTAGQTGKFTFTGSAWKKTYVG